MFRYSARIRVFVPVLALLVLGSFQGFAQRRYVSASTANTLLQSDAFASARTRIAKILGGGNVPSACTGFDGSVFCGSSLNGVLGGSGDCLSDQYYIDMYLFNGNAGQKLTASVTPQAGKRVYVAIQSYDTANILVSDDGYGTVTVTYTLPSTAQLIIGIAFVETYGTGTYTLNVSCENAPPPTDQCFLAARIACPQTYYGMLESSENCWYGEDYYADAYAFEGTKGVPIRITVSSAVPLYLEIAAPDASVGAYLQGHQTEEMEYVPSYDGDHRILVSTFNKRTLSSYTISVECVPANCRQRALRR